MSRTRRPGRRRDSAAWSRRAHCPAPATDHHGPVIWAWLETVSLPDLEAARPDRGEPGGRGAVRASKPAVLPVHAQPHRGAFLVKQTWFVIAFLVRRPPSAAIPGAGCWRSAGHSPASCSGPPTPTRTGELPPAWACSWPTSPSASSRSSPSAAPSASWLPTVAWRPGAHTPSSGIRYTRRICSFSRVPAAKHLAAQCPGHRAGQRL